MIVTKPVHHHAADGPIRIPKTVPAAHWFFERLRSRQNEGSIQPGHRADIAIGVLAFPVSSQFLLDFASLGGGYIPPVPVNNPN